MAIYRKVYYDKDTGQVIMSYGYSEQGFVITTLIQDYYTFKELNNRHIDQIGLIELEEDNYDEDFRLCGNNIQVDLVTKEFTFNYPTTNGITSSNKGLVEEMNDLKNLNESLNLAIIELFDILLG